ncbi:glycosyltransferase family 4 protein [Cobetia amphilecti]|uniref:glycosyltransferase family 4 protein n=1 Tax=Cobetia amphilecti TaxID=1055104 RepID=UPI000A05DFAA|nr:glycosyltransferase family 4 protein [Cobetia amphilecti]
MKFCFVDRANAHSIWSLIDIISIELIKRGDSVLYCKLIEEDTAYTRQVPDSVQLELIYVPKKKNVLDLLKQVYVFSKKFKNLISDVDVLHTNFAYPGVFAKYLAANKIPVVITTQHEVYHSMNIHWKVLLNITQKYTDSVVYISEEVEKSYKTVSSPKCEKITIKNGVNVEYLNEVAKKCKSNSKRMSVVCVGRLVPEKGQRVLIEAWPIVLQRAPLAKLSILGTGPDEDKLKARCVELNILGNIEFHGWLPKSDTVEKIACANLIVVPSQHEGFGLVIAEAMGLRTPLVCSNIDVFHEIADDTASYFPPNNHVELARSILKNLSTGVSDAKLTKALNRVTECFNEKNMAIKYIELYDKQLSRKGVL